MGLNAVQSYPAERVLVAALLGRPASFYELGGPGDGRDVYRTGAAPGVPCLC